jgi:hypothetical protein
MKYLTAAVAALLYTGVAMAQQPDAKPKAEPIKPIVKPKAPVKPVVPEIQRSASQSTNGKPAPALSIPAEIGVALTPQAATLAGKAQLKAITPAIRSRLATRLLATPVTLASPSSTLTVSPGEPVQNGVWLSAKGGTWTTHPRLQPSIALPNVTVDPSAAITLRWEAAANMRYLLVCAVSAPAAWDIALDGRATPLVAEDEVTASALIPPVAPAQTRVVKLVVQRIGVPTAPQQNEMFRRCEVTPITG